MMIKRPRLFLAYSSEDKEPVGGLYARLKAEGFNIWLAEKDLLPGENWTVEIPKAIWQCDYLIVCLSERAINEQGYMEKEFRMALDIYARNPPGSIYLIPLKFNDCEVPSIKLPQLGLDLNDIRWLEYWKPDGFEQFLAAINNKREFGSNSPPSIPSSDGDPEKSGNASSEKVTASIETNSRSELLSEGKGQESVPSKDMPDWMLIVSVVSALVFITVLLALAVLIPKPDIFPMFVFRIVLALSAAAFGATIPGFLKLQLPLPSKGIISAGGAIVLFVVIYQFNPPNLIDPGNNQTDASIVKESLKLATELGVKNEIIKDLFKLLDGPAPASAAELDSSLRKISRSYNNLNQKLNISNLKDSERENLLRNRLKENLDFALNKFFKFIVKRYNNNEEVKNKIIAVKEELMDSRRGLLESERKDFEEGEDVPFQDGLEPSITLEDPIDIDFLFSQSQSAPVDFSKKETRHIQAPVIRPTQTLKSETQSLPTEFLNNLGMKFVYISPGEFRMGNPSDEPGRNKDARQHKVILRQGFYLQTTEVTQDQWRAVMGKNPSYFKNCGDDCPVENISWKDVQEFIKKLNESEDKHRYRLPTEAEWEYAARAGSDSAFANGGIGELYCGNDSNLNKMGWYCGNSESKTHAVAKKQPNAWGLYDMHGNVWEWCQDRYGDYSTSSVTDPTGPSSGAARVLRGGCWKSYARYCRSAGRNRDVPGRWNGSFGFRLAGIPFSANKAILQDK